MTAKPAEATVEIGRSVAGKPARPRRGGKRHQSRRAPAACRWNRGVYEMEVAPRGYRAFNVVYSNGDIAFHQVPEERVSLDLVRRLRAELDRDDPVAGLRVIRGGES